MRIALANWSRRRIGGTETYLNNLIPRLLDFGHELLFLSEVNEPSSREKIAFPDSLPFLCVAESGREFVVAALRDWQPDVIYVHGIHNTTFEEDLLALAPAIFLAHTFTGTCISGQKTFKRPVVTPCHRRFGWECLLHYYPHRCGGLNPITMARLYLSQAKRLENLRRYRAIVTRSSYMYEEFINHGFDPGSVHKLHDHTNGSAFLPAAKKSLPRSEGEEVTETAGAPASRLLYIGRMEFLKGGEIFLDALPQAHAQLGRALHVTFAGDGPDRHKWEDKGSHLQSQNTGLSIDFAGWVNSWQLDSILSDADLLVVPSLWPEPFGLVGLEAGRSGVPVAAFAVGGISAWLCDGVNGYLAPGSPPTPAGLAGAIVKCLESPNHHAELRRGALKVFQSFDMDVELRQSLSILEQVRNKFNSPAIVNA
jgi:glycosyltransferase involved in cell wall biosynthesis